MNGTVPRQFTTIIPFFIYLQNNNRTEKKNQRSTYKKSVSAHQRLHSYFNLHDFGLVAYSLFYTKRNTIRLPRIDYLLFFFKTTVI